MSLLLLHLLLLFDLSCWLENSLISIYLFSTITTIRFQTFTLLIWFHLVSSIFEVNSFAQDAMVMSTVIFYTAYWTFLIFSLIDIIFVNAREFLPFYYNITNLTFFLFRECYSHFISSFIPIQHSFRLIAYFIFILLLTFSTLNQNHVTEDHTDG